MLVSGQGCSQNSSHWKPWTQHSRQACKAVGTTLGYSSLKEEQLEVMVRFIWGKDVFAVLPAGFDKSLCYACLAGPFDSLYSCSGSVVVVISPLMANIKDQLCSVCVPIGNKDKGLSASGFKLFCEGNACSSNSW